MKQIYCEFIGLPGYFYQGNFTVIDSTCNYFKLGSPNECIENFN